MNCVIIKVEWSDMEKDLLTSVRFLGFVMKAEGEEPLKIWKEELIRSVIVLLAVWRMGSGEERFLPVRILL